MSATHYCVNWDSYKNCILNGFCRLQQNGEFVDMTLAAEGHLVKVHQNIVALASPYLKAMIQSATCPHPVIFLNPEPLCEPLLESQQDILPELLEEVLPGSPVEVLSHTQEEGLPYSKVENLQDLQLEKLPESQPEVLADSKQGVSKAMPYPHLDILPIPHSKPLPESLSDALFESIILRPKEISQPQQETQLHELPDALHEIERVNDPPENNFAAHITINSDNNYNLEVKQVEQNVTQNKACPIITVDNYVVNYDNSFCEVDDNATANLQAQPLPLISIKSENMNLEPYDNLVNNERNGQNIKSTEGISNVGQIKQNMFFKLGLEKEKPVAQPIRKQELLSKEERDKIVHYSISNRGSLQLMLNGHIYCCHHQSCEGRKRRWRCIDYRKLHCPAIIDTDNEVIINRSDLHNHDSHVSKILKKFKSKLIFTSIKPAEEKCKFLKESETKTEYSKPKTKRRKFIE